MPSLQTGMHFAYALMIIGVIFSFVLSRNKKKDMRRHVDAFAIPFCRLSNHISPTAPEEHLLVEELPDGGVRPLPAEEQPKAIRQVLRRGNSEFSAKLYAKMQTAFQALDKEAGRNRRDQEQFGNVIYGLLEMTHTFLAGCEDLSTIDTKEKQQQFESFLQDQVDHRMTLLRRIRGETADEYRELNKAYAAQMEAREKQEAQARAPKARKA